MKKIGLLVLACAVVLLGALPAGATQEPPPRSYYLSAEAEVTGVTAQPDGWITVEVKDAENPESVTHFNLTGDTYIESGAVIEEGQKLIFFYEADRPVMLIYPPRYQAAMVVAPPAEGFVKADWFDGELVSRDNTLKLNPGEETELVAKDGTPYEGELEDHPLLVYYTVSTRSIPAQTVPSKVVVLDRQFSLDVEGYDVVVENTIIESPSPYTDKDGTVMVPVRAVAEALGYDVTWEEAEGRVRIGTDISFVVGSGEYGYAVDLKAAPVLKDARTYVPIAFFKQVMGLSNAYVFEGQLVFDNGEEMH